MADKLSEQIAKPIDAKAQELADKILSGKCKDYAEYVRLANLRLGLIEGRDKAIEAISTEGEV